MDSTVLHNKTLRTDIRTGQTIKDMLTLTFVDPDQYNYRIFRVPSEYIARPDLISIDQYGSDAYVDIICKLNGISNPFELNEGMLLILPSTGHMALFYYNSDNIPEDDSDNNQTPKPKQRKEKRKANESVIGDRRFKIDKEKRVVIY